ncbi:methyltransferase domain-containing protein [Saccharopolyspora cebuensis]|uniref:Class I SAM-dependent methyltransferase n=1 Tax=Saccharopolyspora cebuensis TaxID=418759 RepID=A0ABV4CC30_9PSEU
MDRDPTIPEAGPEPMTDVRTDYVFDNAHPQAVRQHRYLAEAHDPLTLARLAETGVGPGWHCLDVGTGGGSVAAWLADRVAPSGSVLATDVDPGHVRPRPGLTALAHDIATDPLPEARFDLIVARLVLRHLPDRAAVLDRLVRALVPGGWLQVDEFDTTYEPLLLAPDESTAHLYRRFLAAKDAVMRAGGVDPAWGRRVPEAMRAAGLVDIDPRPHVQLRHPGAADLLLLEHHTHHLRDGLLAAGMTEADLGALRSALREPELRACSSVMYSVHGRKPAR